MTCRAARRLLPLLSGGDLDARQMRDVSGHVATCGTCRAEADAFTQARSLLPLASFTFAESERALVRRRVLEEIGRRGSPSPLLAFLVRPRFALAALAGAVVLAASLLSPFFVRNDGEPAAALPARPRPSAPPVPAEARVAEPAVSAPDRSTAIARATRAGKAARPPAPSSTDPGPAMRFEIQTGNVNVRIIWFAGGNSGGVEPPGPTSDSNDVS